ncbi:MAG: hypothetical protein COA43_06385 [Robiginitomaculum sp.]|nr:MAG: hypothetical protein COA43_06385 [Robiginitomaculum sp.]
MIKYMLKCCQDHEFEAWFGHSSDFDDQACRGLIACPHCGDVHIEKAPMAPHIRTSKSNTRKFDEIAEEMRRDIEKNCENVGDDFADTARAIHYGDAPERGIYGQATIRQAQELAEEGIETLALPDAITPRNKTKLN